MLSDEEIRLLYGKDAVISRKGRFILVHLDHPSSPCVRARTREFDPDQYFDPDCPICRMQREEGVVIFDDQLGEDDDDDLPSG